MSSTAPRNGRHILFLDHLRGLAILLVFAFHCFQLTYLRGVDSNSQPLAVWAHASWQEWLLFPVSLGWVGVAIFFVVSGFCIHLSHVRSSRASWKIFFLRRFFRIYPPYLVALILFAIVFPATRSPGTRIFRMARQSALRLLVQLVDWRPDGR